MGPMTSPTPKAVEREKSGEERMEALIEGVENAVGMGHGAWDMVNPADLIRAVLFAASVQGLEAQRGEAQRLVEECAPFLKEGETPAECIARNRRDAEAVFLYYSDAHRWRFVRDNWHDISGRFFPVIGSPGPSWNRPNDPDALTRYVDEQRASSPSACVAPTAGVPTCDGGKR